jgi:general secretion pathway protein D
LALCGTGTAQAENFTLNLKGADLRNLIETVSEATGKNFIVDPAVKGQVTVLTAKPMTADELYQVFLSILELHNFIAVPSGNVIQIVPDKEMKHRGFTPDELVPPPDEVETGKGVVVEVLEVKHLPANRLHSVLRPLLSPRGSLVVNGTEQLVATDYADHIGRLKSILKRVDRPDMNGVEVIPIQHSSAVEMVKALDKLDKHGQTNAPGEKALIMADERTNSVLVSGNPDDRLRIRTLISHLDTPVEREGGNTQVVYLRFAKSKDIAPVLQSMGEDFLKRAKDAKEAPENRGVVNVQPYESANALVITAPTELLDSLRAVVRQLDIRRAQVQVEAVIAEVVVDKANEIGIQWRGMPGGSTGMVGGSAFSTSGAPNLNLLSNPDNLAAVGSGLSVGYLDGVSTIMGKEYLNLAMLVRMFASDVVTNILSTPTVVTLDNESAEMVVGKEVPFRTGEYVNTSNSVNNPFVTITRGKVGLTLKVTPQINEGDSVRLDIEQETSDITGTSASLGAADVVTNTRSIKTVVMVDDRQVLVLGGLIKDDQQEFKDKVPVLGDVPLLGNLFRYTVNKNVKTNLMVFLRPTVLRTPQDGVALTYQKYNFLRDRQLDLPQERGIRKLEAQSPLLPALEEYLSREAEMGEPRPENCGQDRPCARRAPAEFAQPAIEVMAPPPVSSYQAAPMAVAPMSFSPGAAAPAQQHIVGPMTLPPRLRRPVMEEVVARPMPAPGIPTPNRPRSAPMNVDQGYQDYSDY